MKKTATVKDVANLAGVAPSTVSFVLNRTIGQTISETTKAKVLEAATALNYRPESTSVLMRRRSSRTIGLVAPESDDLRFNEMSAGVMSAAEEEGFGVLMCSSKREMGEISYISAYHECRIDGVVLVAPDRGNNLVENEHIHNLLDAGIPFATVCSRSEIPNIHQVNINFYQCGMDAGTHLFKSGCRKVICISPLDGRHSHASASESERLRGFSDAARMWGCEPRIKYLPRSFESQELGSAKAFLASAAFDIGVDGYAATWAACCVWLIAASKDMGLRLDKSKVISMEKSKCLQLAYPDMPYMTQPFYDVAKSAAKNLVQNCFNSEDRRNWPAASEIIACRLVDETRVAAASDKIS
ncbi:MAG: LacI family transcriptional regulator [Clostridiales bacterium]|nr:LacI family transcriptional regulator [Clostridiales bacterium]